MSLSLWHVVNFPAPTTGVEHWDCSTDPDVEPRFEFLPISTRPKARKPGKGETYITNREP